MSSKKVKIEVRQSEDMQMIDDELDAALRALEDANVKVNEVLEVEKTQRGPAPLFTGIPEGTPAEDDVTPTQEKAE